MPGGVDEAGKGPALGPMVAAAVWAPSRDRLPDGVADSKDLSPERRESIAARLRADEAIAIGVARITPARIDAPETDMNGLAVEAHAGAIEDALAGSGSRDDGPRGASSHDDDMPRGVCDACDTDADRFARRVQTACATDVTIDARHGADAEDSLVAAASVVAKVDRDAQVAAIATEYRDRGYPDVGSGYPSDPSTRTFLETYVEDNGTLPDCARRSWKTCRDVLARVEQRGLADYASE